MLTKPSWRWEPWIAFAWLMVMLSALVLVCGKPLVSPPGRDILLIFGSFIAIGLCLQGMRRDRQTIGAVICGVMLVLYLGIDLLLFWSFLAQ
ncbi:MAG: hypothetical protein R3236_06855 [Phycisphaeraceae bacterium]|nr:hypothetical protein [Phycisphaeraceae bacterium]